MINTEILQDILTDHKLVNTQRKELEKAIQLLSKSDEIDNLYLDMFKEVNHYIELNEQGRLIELPFKVKDTVYLVDFSDEKIDEAEMLQISIYEHGNEYVSDLLTFYEEDINVVVFLTKAEAEKALAESEGDK